MAVTEVLTSVQKTEESLRRLKNLREKTAPTVASTIVSPTDQQQGIKMTDDDKIRQQLLMDVLHWADAIERLGIERTQVDRLIELIRLVEESTRIKTTG